jgi:hypothetical protein
VKTGTIVRWDEDCRVVRIGLVDVTQDHDLMTLGPGVPEINWSAIGAVHIEETERFIDDLRWAVKLCRWFLTSKKLPWAFLPKNKTTLRLPGITLRKAGT